MNNSMHPTHPALPEFDADGFVVDPANWSERVAQAIAQHDGLGPLSPQQLAVLGTLREAFGQTADAAALSHVCHLNGLEPDCLHRLFPDPRSAWRLAGLSNPGEEARAYLA
jgi:Dissimilatory sulfite reductase (desulfoviridin), gamma subunit